MVQANLRKVSICDTEQDLEGKHGTGGYRNSRARRYKTVAACLMTIAFHLVPKERQYYVNIYLFIALSSDFLTPFE